MKLVSIESLKDNDVVLVNRPVPEEGGITHRFYIGRVVEPSNYAHLGKQAAPGQLVMLDSWFEKERDGEHVGEELNSYLHFDKDEEGATAQVIGRWNPETRQIEPLTRLPSSVSEALNSGDGSYHP